MNILVDLDATLSNFTEVLLSYLNTTHGTHYHYDDINHWDWLPQMFRNPWEPLKEEKFWDDVEISESGIEFVKEMVKRRHNVYIVTASGFTDYLPIKIQKTLKTFEGILTENNIVIARDKSIIAGDLMIDDNEVNLYKSRCPEKILFAQPWNRNAHINFPRLDSWELIGGYVNTL